MNFGMQDIQNIIYRQLVQGNANVTGGRGKFAKDLAKRIYELVEGENMNADMRIQALARGIPDRAIKIHDKLCKALGFEVMQLTPFASDVYEWVGTQEAQGQSISTFAAWAKNSERVQYIGKYRKDAGAIQRDWASAFENSAVVMRASDEGI